jgi:predicted RNase H-like HicB family nuclease
MNLTLRCEQDVDGQWLAEVVELPGYLGYGPTPERALAEVQELALRHLADEVEAQGAPVEVQFQISTEKPRRRHLADEPDPADVKAYAAWMNERLEEAIDDDGPTIPHEEAIRRIRLSLKLS